MDLPPDAIPWGRWYENLNGDTATAIQRQQQDSSSVGSLFTGRADTLEDQINGIPSVAAIYERVVPPFSVSRASTPGATFYAYDSGTYTFNPPRPDRDYDFSVIANMDASGTLFTFSYSLLRVNGTDFMFNHENTQPGYTTSPTFSIMGGGKVGAGGVVNAEFALATSSTGTVNFAPTRLWCIFTGSLN